MKDDEEKVICGTVFLCVAICVYLAWVLTGLI